MRRYLRRWRAGQRLDKLIREIIFAAEFQQRIAVLRKRHGLAAHFGRTRELSNTVFQTRYGKKTFSSEAPAPTDRRGPPAHSPFRKWLFRDGKNRPALPLRCCQRVVTSRNVCDPVPDDR